ncbi:MAG: hypothetical protein IPK66_14760 [Rhodospirillales bacterium]|nr:hypothetical protein [Rhodospirillales bacterium]
MFDALKTMDEDQLREMISAIAGSADPWSSDVMAMGIDVVDAIGDELMRRSLRNARRAATN